MRSERSLTLRGKTRFPPSSDFDEESAKHLAERFGAAVTQDADGADFLYPAENFIAYAGKRLREKRNHLYQFRREYPDAVFEPIGDANIHEVMTFFEAYRAENGSDEALAATENDICREVLENRGSYGISFRLRCGLTAGSGRSPPGRSPGTRFSSISKRRTENPRRVSGDRVGIREVRAGDKLCEPRGRFRRPRTQKIEDVIPPVCPLLGKYTAVIR